MCEIKINGVTDKRKNTGLGNEWKHEVVNMEIKV